jgi:hypothetical protein
MTKIKINSNGYMYNRKANKSICIIEKLISLYFENGGEKLMKNNFSPFRFVRVPGHTDRG